jgi:hypothetical protein
LTAIAFCVASVALKLATLLKNPVETDWVFQKPPEKCEQQLQPKQENKESNNASIQQPIITQGANSSVSPLANVKRRQHAILIPYRNREVHLKTLTKKLGDYLQKHFENSDFSLWIIEQDNDELFNRGWLANIGLAEILKYQPETECIVFHDVDLVPDDSGQGVAPYDQCDKPVQLGSELQHWKWGVPYPAFAGGVVSMSADHWKQINGFSNQYIGWGLEDDDLYQRLRLNHMLMGVIYPTLTAIYRPPRGHGIFLTIDENRKSHHPVNKKRGNYQESKKLHRQMENGSSRWQKDGLNALVYKINPNSTRAEDAVTNTAQGFSSTHHVLALPPPGSPASNLPIITPGVTSQVVSYKQDPFAKGSSWVSVATDAPVGNKNSPNTSSPRNSSIVPAKLHFIHVSKGLPQNQSEIPSNVRKIVDDWKMMHPQWQVRIWDNTMVRQEFPDLIPVLSKLDTMAWVADLLRYHIIERYGGVYLDTDIVPLRSLEPLRKLGSFTVCERPREAAIPTTVNSTSTNLLIMSGCTMVCNAIIAAPKSHPALAHAVEVSMRNTVERIQRNGGKHGGNFALTVSGPAMWTKAVEKHAFNILYSPTFYPCDWSKRNECVKSRFENIKYVYAMHMWAGSWT